MKRDKNQINDFEILKENLSYLKEEEIKKVFDAFVFAKEMHDGQFRMSGEEYIIHPLNVAYILSGIKADSDSICAALLHDTIEDCDIKKEQLETKFNKDVAELVDSLTKINRMNFQTETDALAQNQKKILIGMTKDVRAIILKLADRLHNMRTIWALSETSQKKNAKETLDILTPIAHRLGIHSLKSELEDLSLRYLKPEAYYQVVEKLNNKKLKRDEFVNKMIQTVSDTLTTYNIKHEIKGRSKSIYSIYKKLDKGKTFDDIYDLLALRIFVDTEEQCYQVLGLIHSKFKPIPKRFKDYVAVPKTNMYQSLHTTVFGVESNVFEIQIRTHEMDKIAENGIASHWSYKEGKSNMQNSMENKLQFFRVIMDLKEENSEDNEFVSSVKEDVLNECIYVYTPEGDIIELPKGATPIDFAYRVHSKVGDTMVGAIVNNKIATLDHELKNYDIIKINTSKNSTPKKEWLNIVKTAQAKNKIKGYFSKLAKEDYVKKGEDLLNKELRKRKISQSTFFDEGNIKEITHKFKISDLHELYINVGNGKIKLDTIFEHEEKEEKQIHTHKVDVSNSKNDILVKGIDDIKVNLAKCCNPVKGDKIIGYISTNNGINIHRMACPNVFELTDRFIDVEWNNNVIQKYKTAIIIRAVDNAMMDIVAKCSGNEIIIDNIANLNNFNYEVVVVTPNKEKLVKYINDLRNVTIIKEVERLIK